MAWGGWRFQTHAIDLIMLIRFKGRINEDRVVENLRKSGSNYRTVPQSEDARVGGQTRWKEGGGEPVSGEGFGGGWWRLGSEV